MSLSQPLSSAAGEVGPAVGEVGPAAGRQSSTAKCPSLTQVGAELC